MLRRPLHAGAAVLAMAAVLAPGSTAPAQEAERPSINLYGVPGVIDMPGAIVQPDGQMTVSYSAFGNTTRRNFTFQILPRVSGTLRYSTINAWGKPNDPDYDLFDRSFDLHLQILNEQPGWQPSLTLGFRDFLGTGVYSAEYLVASKTVWRDFTLTGGVGWGRLAGVEHGREPVLRRRRLDVRARRRLRQGREARLGPLLPRRGHGLLRRRRVAHADRQADAEGRNLVRRLYARAARSRRQLRSELAVQLRRRVPHPARRHARRLLHVRRHARREPRAVGQPEEAAGAAEPRAGTAAGQPAAGGRQPQHRLGRRCGGAARR